MLGFGLGLLQMVFYAIYRNRGEKIITKENKLPLEPLKSVVVIEDLSQLGEVEKKDEDEEEGKKSKDGTEEPC